MKTFLNVLYRRILYKIPLKLLLVLLAVFGLLFACFSSALTLNSSDYPWQFIFNLRSVQWNVDISPAWKWITCVNLDRDSWGTFYDWENTYTFQNWNTYCTDSSTVKINTNWYYAYYWYFFWDSFMKQFYPDYTSQQCQSEYNLIPINEVDSAYCESNNLCSSSWSPTDCPNVWVSNVFINDLFHPWAFNIVMNIPEEIDWDYAYTNSWENMNIDVFGYNVDYEKIQSVVDLQNYKPTDEDFTEIIWILAPYSKIIIFFVVLFSLWAMIKKPFKSKKL